MTDSTSKKNHPIAGKNNWQAERGRFQSPTSLKTLPRWATMVIIFVFWSLVATFMLSGEIWGYFSGDTTCPNLAIIYAKLPQYGFWALMTPFLFRLPGHPRLVKMRLWSRIGFFFVLGLVILTLVGLINGMSHNLFYHGFGTWHTGAGWTWLNFLGQTHPNFMIYLALLSTAFAWNYFQEHKVRQLKEIQLQNQLTHAKLQALQIQIQPHFLFNTLNTVSALVDRDPQATKRVVARLSQLLRYSLDSTQEQTVTLEQELCFLSGYLEILEIRFGDRMVFDLEIEDKARDCMVPNLLLQPLVENAIKHGFSRMPKNGRITIGAKQANDRLHLWVYDNGKGADLAHLKLGLGLGNLRDRLQNLYGEDSYWEIGTRQDGGLSVDIYLPMLLNLEFNNRSAADSEAQSA